MPGFFRMWSALFSQKTRDQFMSFTKVYNKEKPLEAIDESDVELAAAEPRSR